MIRLTTRRIGSAVLLALCVPMFAACGGRSSGVGGRIAPPAVNVARIEVQPDGNGSGSVSIDQFEDTRPGTELAAYEGSLVQPESDIVPNVRTALTTVLEKKGIMVSDTAPLVIGVEIREWKVNVSRGFQTKAEATAGVFIRVFDPANKLIYSGLYRGNAHLQQSSMKEPELADVLSTSMSEALAQVTRDGPLLQLLRSF
ncbi:MAG: hypothetical protein IT290_03750 [Deltaproteobacteria bacterium]|nr:hypothetical protein [Deltaproteobacteria bacterium]